MIMCHMIAQTIDELHAMADKIGANRKWFEPNASSPHYYICKSKRSNAVKFGAIEVDSTFFFGEKTKYVQATYI